MSYKRKLPVTLGQFAPAAKPPKEKAQPKLFIREEDIPRLQVVTRAGAVVEIELLCGDGEKENV